MKAIALAIMLILPGGWVCCAQGKPTGDCSFPYAGFATAPGQRVQIAEVATRAAVELEECGSEKGCVVSPAAWGTPVLIYREQGSWTCGYFSGRDGAGPAWIRSDALRVVPYDTRPPLNAWVGTWTGGEDRVLILVGSMPGTLHLVGKAEWHGQGSGAHFGDTEGGASPVGNRLHFVQNGPNSCTIDMTLLNRYILASDNGLCGALNARFQGIWKHIGP
jgi:hypothetical protein